MFVGQFENLLIGKINACISDATAKKVSKEMLIGSKGSSHDNALRLLHVLNCQVPDTIHFSLADIVVVDENAGNVQNTKVRTVGSRDFNLQDLGSKILPSKTFSGPYTQILF